MTAAVHAMWRGQHVEYSARSDVPERVRACWQMGCGRLLRAGCFPCSSGLGGALAKARAGGSSGGLWGCAVDLARLRLRQDTASVSSDVSEMELQIYNALQTSGNIWAVQEAVELCSSFNTREVAA